jgi:hypothetical protein
MGIECILGVHVSYIIESVELKGRQKGCKVGRRYMEGRKYTQTGTGRYWILVDISIVSQRKPKLSKLGLS